jgi:hypothetical protein
VAHYRVTPGRQRHSERTAEVRENARRADLYADGCSVLASAGAQKVILALLPRSTETLRQAWKLVQGEGQVALLRT